MAACIFERDNFMKTAIDIHAHRNGGGRIFFLPASHPMTKARTPKSPSDILFRVEGTLFFVTICPGRVEAFGRLAMKSRNNVKFWLVGCVLLLLFFFCSPAVVRTS